MRKAKRLTKSAAKERLTQEWQEALATCFGFTPTEVRRLSEVNLVKEVADADNLSERAATEQLKVGLAFAMATLGRTHLKEVDVTTEEELAKAVQQVREVKEKMPTVMRKALKDLVRALPRRGGPGRQPKMNSKEASQMCDQIMVLIRRKYNLKQALQKASELSPTILGGKKVSPRTLQKAWDRRDEFTNG